MQNYIKLIFLTFLLCSASCFAENHQIYQFATPKQQQQFKTLTYELRCLVCQNQNLAESNASLADDLRDDIANMVREGQTNQSIIHYLVQRYGDYILYKPPVAKNTWVLWFGPFAFLILGLVVLFSFILFMKKKHTPREQLTQQEQDKVQKLLDTVGE